MSKWEMVRLGDVANFNMGQSPSSKSYNDKGQGIPFFQGKTDFGLVFPTIRMYCTDPKKIAKKDDVLISVRAPVGAVNIATETCCIGRGLAAISPMVGKTNYKYIYYYLQYKENDIANMGVGSTFKAISKKDLNTIDIPLPPLEIQRQIAGVLDRASTLVRKREAQIDKLDLLVKSQFIEMFGDPVTNPKDWEYTTLGDIADISSSKRIFESEYVEKGIPFFRTKEIVELSKGASISTELFITKERYNEIKVKYELPQIGDLLVSAVGTIGIIWVVDTNESFYFKDGNLLWIRCGIDSNSIFMKYLLTSLIDYYKKDLVAGSAYNALTITKLKKMKTHNPPLELQSKFADFVQQVEAQKSLFQRSLAKLELTYKSLMQKCFRGEIF